MEIVTDVDKLRVDLQEVFMNYKTIKQWAYIVHDKDDTRPHYHIYLHFDTGVDTALVAKWFDVPENFINKVKGRQSDMLKYLTHSNASQKFKHQYDASEVIANFDFEKTIEESQIVGNFDQYSYAQQLAYVNSLDVSEKTRMFTQLEKLWKIKCQSDCLKTERNIQVIFVTGKSGTGKTFFAKRLMEKLGYDYCVSSSSNDPFQDYLGQKGIILDDLRDSSFELNDLLKILDNYTNSSVRSRFTNKVFNGEIIIITSSVPIKYWYSWLKGYDEGRDSLIQLYRRINTCVVVSETFIEIFEDGLTSTGSYKGKPKFVKNEVIEIKNGEKEKRKISDLYEKLDYNDDDLPF